MRLCIGTKAGVYCCSDTCSSKLGTEYLGTHEGVCFAKSARFSYSVHANEKSSTFMLQRTPKLWYDTGFSFTFIAHPEVILSLMGTLAQNDPYANIFGQVQVGEFAVPKIIRAVGFTDDCYKLYDDLVIVRSVNIREQGGQLIEMTVQGVKYSSFI